MTTSLKIPTVCALLVAGALAAQDPTPVRTTASDGRAVTGKLYGQSDTALVLCHGRMYTTGADSFADECRALSAKGVMCLALNFRGYPAERPAMLPGQALDVVAAVDYLAGRGAKRICVLGSSMGGFAALEALGSLSAKPQFHGLIVLSAFDDQACRRATCRKLFVVAQDDRRLWPKVLAMFIKAAAPKNCIVFDTGGHGQQLFKTHRQELLEQIRVFVQGARGSVKPG